MSKQDEFLSSIKNNPNKAPRSVSVPQETVWPAFEVGLDRVLVRPLEPERYITGSTIAKSPLTIRTEIALENRGQIVGIGPLAWTAKTRDGVDFSQDIKYEVGDWVFYRPKAGVPMLVRKHADDKADAHDMPRQLVMNDSDILGKFKTREEMLRVWNWVQ